jgi:hypothetical protein
MSDSATTSTNLNLRAGPSTADRIHETLPSGTALRVLGDEGQWLRVRIAGTEREGYVAARFVARAPVAVVVPDVPRDVPAPSSPGVSGFLREDAALAAAPLAPGVKKQPGAGSGAAGTTAARIWNAYGGLLSALAGRLAIEPETGVAVVAVESGGAAFVQGRMVIRFENHIFFDQWGKANPEVYARHFRSTGDARWKGHEFRASADAPWRSFHGNQAGEWEVLEFAQKLDRRAARMSISMGLAQVMGFNFAAVGFASVDAMFDAFADAGSGERAQVVGMFDFIRGSKGTSAMLEALCVHDWSGFARRYNGTGQAEAYGGKLKAAYTAAKGLVVA